MKIQDGYWRGQFQRVNREVASAKESDLVFFGDSITWGWSLGPAKGKAVWEEKYQRYDPINMGNSGDITPVMLYRVTHGNLDFPEGKQPKVAVLLCGTNNFGVVQSDGGRVKWDLGAECPPEEVASGVRAIAQVFRRRLPYTRLILLGILPVKDAAKWAKCQKVNAITAQLKTNPDEVAFLDLQKSFLGADGKIDPSLFSDGTHLTAQGYEVWAKSMDPVLTRMMRASPLNPVKIMLIGGSVTEGADSATSYRRYLDGLLRRKGMQIDFVGSRSRHRNNQLAPDNCEFDPDHEGYWGKDYAWLAKHLPDRIKQSIPDVAVLQIGAEDLAQQEGKAEPLAESLRHIRKLVQTLRAENPRVKVLLVPIPPQRGKNEPSAAINQRLAQFAKQQSKAASPLILTELPVTWDASRDLSESDQLPTASGAKHLAEAIAKSIGQLLLEPHSNRAG